MLGTTVIKFDSASAVPAGVDAIWDPRAGGGNAPIKALCGLTAPLLVTLHGVAPMAIPLREYYGSLRQQYRGWRLNNKKIAAWRRAKGSYGAVVTVSESSRESILDALPIDPSSISWCHNAVNHAQFTANAALAQADYFLHVSNDEPRKNVERICQAYRELPREGRPRLVLKLPADSTRSSEDGIEVINTRLDDAQLLSLYHNALAFVFPSTFEGFGLPIVEAMASGCPVITSNTHACGEVAADAALVVDPASTEALKDAMQSLSSDTALRASLRLAGLERAQMFRWSNAAQHYQSVFQRLVELAITPD